jgi:precorrin-6A/cobalt-precorrin-6A reductase
MRRVLILGGTTEARQLAEVLATRGHCDVTVSLAGRTAAPAQYRTPTRIGGFGGSEGLANYLISQRVVCLIDATHPYAARISANAARAAQLTGVELITLHRPAWQAVAGDRWTTVADINEAILVLGRAPRRVFLPLGRQDISGFERAPQHFYLVRSVEPIDRPLAVSQAAYVVARGPFTEPVDRALLKHHCIDVVVAKNSGGRATYGKIAAARGLGIAVIMLRRPPRPVGPACQTVAEVIDFLDHGRAVRSARGV